MSSSLDASHWANTSQKEVLASNTNGQQSSGFMSLRESRVKLMIVTNL